jgi:hypothetical protein
MPEVFQEALAMLTLFGGLAVTVGLMVRWVRPGIRRGAHDAPQDVRLEALKLHERLAREKLEVLKQAVNMGWDDEQLKALDARLEQLVGREGIERIASGELLTRDVEPHALTPEQELAALKRDSER